MNSTLALVVFCLVVFVSAFDLLAAVLVPRR